METSLEDERTRLGEELEARRLELEEELGALHKRVHAMHQAARCPGSAQVSGAGRRGSNRWRSHRQGHIAVLAAVAPNRKALLLDATAALASGGLTGAGTRGGVAAAAGRTYRAAGTHEQ